LHCALGDKTGKGRHRRWHNGVRAAGLFSGQVERVQIFTPGRHMFHLVTGSDPQDNPLLIFDFTKNPRPRQINPAMSTEMERILIRAVEYKPESRFSSAAEMRDMLAAHLEKLQSGQVSYGIRPTSWAAKRSRFETVVLRILRRALPRTISSAPIVARDNPSASEAARRRSWRGHGQARVAGTAGT